MKAHYEALDGLRGTAAISVVIFHLFELMVPDLDHNPMPHTFLAVDFFFALSGYVLAYAYDGRLQLSSPVRLRFWEFVERRLIRLHPVVPVAACVGAIAYLCDPNVGTAQSLGIAISPLKMLTAFVLGLFLLPSAPLPNLFGETHPINPPSWTLFWEYVANLFYITLGWRLKRALHVVLLVVAALALAATAHFYKGNLGYGWGWHTVWVAPIRLAYPFLAGILVCRMGWKIALPQPFLCASVVLLLVFLAPRFGFYNGMFEAACVIFVFPLVLMMGASVTRVEGVTGPLCRFIGQLSYPLYIIHYPFVLMYGHWNWHTQPDNVHLHIVMVAMVLFLFAVASLLLYAWDLPVRRWLRQRCLRRESS